MQVASSQTAFVQNDAKKQNEKIFLFKVWKIAIWAQFKQVYGCKKVHKSL